MALKSTTHLDGALDVQQFQDKGDTLKALFDELQALFHNTTGHDHSAADKGKAIVTAGIGANAVTSAKMEVDLLQYADVQVTNTQMLALLGTDITLVAAPGANKALVVHAAYLFFDSAAAYTLGTAALAIGYGGDNADILAITEAGFLDQATDQARIYYLGGAAATPVIVTPTANQPVVLRATSADLTGGNAANTVSIRVWFSTCDMVAFT